jgi:hypothetical protein
MEAEFLGSGGGAWFGGRVLLAALPFLLLCRMMKNTPTPRIARAANPPTAPPTIAAIGAPDELVDELTGGPAVLLVAGIEIEDGVEVEVEVGIEVEAMVEVDELGTAFELVVFDEAAPLLVLVRVMVAVLKVRPSFSPL